MQKTGIILGQIEGKVLYLELINLPLGFGEILAIERVYGSYKYSITNNY